MRYVLHHCLLGALLVASEMLSAANRAAGGHMLVDLSVRNTIAASLVEMLNDAFVRDKQQRVFNFYSHLQRADSQTQVGFFGELIDETLRQLSRRSDGDFILVRAGLAQVLPGDSERHYSVLLVDGYQSLSFLYHCLELEHLYVSGYFIVVLHTFTPYYYAELYRIAELNWRVGILNANVLVYVAHEQMLLFTTQPYNRFHCGGYAPVIQNRYSGGQWLFSGATAYGPTSFFPDKLANMHGCPVSCATLPEMPYFALGTRSQDYFLGIEGKLLDYLATRFNFTLQFRWLSAAEKARTLHDSADIFDELFSRGIDFAIGALRYKPMNDTDPYAPSSPYYLSSFHFITSSSTTPYSPYAKLLFPFVPEIWLLIAVYYASGIVVCLLVRCGLNASQRNFIFGARNRSPVYNMFVVSLGGTVARLPDRNFARYLLTLWLATTLVLRSAYQAFMYHFIRMDINHPPPANIEDLLARNFTLIMTDMTFDAMASLAHIRHLAHVTNYSNFDAFEWLRTTRRHVAILSAYEYFGYFKRKRLQTASAFHLMPQKVLMQQLSIYMRKNSILLVLFNRYILEYVNSGLMSKWEEVFMDTRMHAAHELLEEQPQAMGLATLRGAFQLLAWGNALGCLAFAVEYNVYVLASAARRLHCSWRRLRQRWRTQ